MYLSVYLLTQDGWFQAAYVLAKAREIEHLEKQRDDLQRSVMGLKRRCHDLQCTASDYMAMLQRHQTGGEGSGSSRFDLNQHRTSDTLLGMY